jgi:NADH:ubiquinone oxidoreductase subunit F (NADH-binding)
MNSAYRLLPDAPFHALQDCPEAGLAFAKAQQLGPEGTIAQIRAANLRGRGGAGFPTATKWANIRAEACPTKYLVCNAAEGEPGTFKDRTLIRANPYVLLEGVAIAAFAIGAKAAYIGLKETFTREYQRLESALKEMTDAGMLGDIPIHLAMGADEYLLGEEKGLLEAIEGNFPFPRISPPYLHGLFVPQGMFVTEGGENPTSVNNAETLSHAARILLHGPEGFRAIGSPEHPGTGIFTLVGDVARPGVYELPTGTSFRTLLEEHGGGMKDGRAFKMMLSGVSSGALTAAHLDVPMDLPSMKAAGSGFGSGGYIVYDETADAVAIANLYSRFLANESCGQCPSCKTGTAYITKHLERLVTGHATEQDLTEIDIALNRVASGNRCYLPVAERTLISSLLADFTEDFYAALKPGYAPGRQLELPKLLDFDPETRHFTFDPKYPLKRPDGSYNPPEVGPYHYA